MNRFKRRIARFVHNPWVDFVLGSLLVVTGFAEVGGSLIYDLSHFNLRIHHGVMLFGIVTMVKALIDLFAGFQLYDEAEIEEKEERKVVNS